MYKKLTLTVLLGGLVIGAMAQHDGAKKRQPLLTAMKAKDIKVADGLMTPEVLWAMGRIGSYDVSEKAGLIVEDVTYYSVERNKSQHVIKTMRLDGSDVKQLTKSAMSESDPVFIQNGTRIAFLSVGTNRKLQVWSMNTDGSNKQQMSNEPDDVEGFIFSPDETKIILIKEVKYGKSTTDIYPDLEKASGMVIDDLMYRHWDETVTSIPHPFIAEVTDGKIHDANDILENEQFECPMKPFGGIEQLAWSPDSRKIAYTCRKKTGLAYSISTDSDIYLYDTAKGQITNLCKPADYKEPEIDPTISMKEQKVNAQGDLNMGYDTNPQFSADGKYVAWLSMARNGYESDRNRLCVYEIATGKKSYVTEKFESGVDNFAWLPGNKSLCFTGVWHGCTMLYTTDLKGNVKKITDGQFDLNSVKSVGKRYLCKQQSMKNPTELFWIDAKGKMTQVSRENDHIMSQLKIGDVKPRWVETVDGKQLHSWVIYPTDFDSTKKYPTLLFCEGGPQSPVSQFWSYRWNFQIMAANGYIVIAPNRRGLPGFGMEWLEEISTNYGGNCMNDYLTAIDDLCKESYVDKDRLGCVGASFGGFSAYWLAGHHNKRFKAFIAHDGFFNMEQQYLETEELWFTNWDLGGAFWRKDSEAVKRSYAQSPHLFVDKWDTPILCIHGEKDYRILASQGMAAFNAAKLRGIPAQLLLFPDENHWVLKPQNGVLWQRTFFSWLDKWLKK